MVITDKLVLLNFPKTGTTFARSVLAELYGQQGWRGRMVRWGLAKPAIQDLKGPRFKLHGADPDKRTQHLVFAQLPMQHRHKPLFSIIRDPFTRLVSAYEYRGWAKAPPAPLERILERHPSFPDLDIEEFVEMNHHFTPEYLLGDIRPAVDLGPATLGFIRFFAREPRKFLEELRPGMRMDLNDGRYFPKIRFLHTEHLNQELHDTLLELGYPEDRLAFILAKPPMNTTRKKEDEYLTPALKARILDKERLLFEAFPEYMP